MPVVCEYNVVAGVIVVSTKVMILAFLSLAVELGEFGCKCRNTHALLGSVVSFEVKRCENE